MKSRYPDVQIYNSTRLNSKYATRMINTEYFIFLPENMAIHSFYGETGFSIRALRKSSQMKQKRF